MGKVVRSLENKNKRKENEVFLLKLSQSVFGRRFSVCNKTIKIERKKFLLHFNLKAFFLVEQVKRDCLFKTFRNAAF